MFSCILLEHVDGLFNGLCPVHLVVSGTDVDRVDGLRRRRTRNKEKRKGGRGTDLDDI